MVVRRWAEHALHLTISFSASLQARGTRLPYTQLLQGLHLWSGHAVAGQATTTLLPHMQSGFLFKRGFLDLRILDPLAQSEGQTDPHRLCAANLLVQNLHLKGITWKVLRSHLAPGHGARCPAPGPLWAPRCVLFVSLPPVSEEILELTLRLAAAQSRKPEDWGGLLRWAMGLDNCFVSVDCYPQTITNFNPCAKMC